MLDLVLPVALVVSLLSGDLPEVSVAVVFVSEEPVAVSVAADSVDEPVAAGKWAPSPSSRPELPVP